MIFKSEGAQTDLNGFLDAGSNVQGDLRFENTFRIDGRFSGRVVSDGTLVVGAGAHLDAEIEVGRIFVSGRVEGKLKAKQGVQIAADGRVYAEIDTPSLVIEDGALFEGRCSMSARPEARAEREPGRSAEASKRAGDDRAPAGPQPVTPLPLRNEG